VLAPQHGSAGQVLRRRVLRPVGRKPAPLPNRGPIPTFPLPWSHTACTLRARQGAGLPWMQQSRRDRGWSGRGRSQQKGGEIVYKAYVQGSERCSGHTQPACPPQLLSLSRSLALSLSRSLVFVRGFTARGTAVWPLAAPFRRSSDTTAVTRRMLLGKAWVNLAPILGFICKPCCSYSFAPIIVLYLRPSAEARARYPRSLLLGRTPRALEGLRDDALILAQLRGVRVL
jgi:hypothetical protein